MAIGKKPKRQQPAPDQERAAEQFIAASSPPVEAHKIMVTLRFDPDLLSRIDAAAKKARCES